MSDPIDCDVCGRTGRRRMNALTPLGWLGVQLFISPEEARIATPADPNAQIYVMAVCSHTCAAAFWQGGGTQPLNEEHPACVRPSDILDAPISGPKPSA